MALCRSAGFARVEYVNTWHRHARVRCYRTWEPVPSSPCNPAPVLQDALNARDYGVNFRSRKEQYVTVWFTCAGEVRREQLRPEIGGYGSHALSLNRNEAGQWEANLRVPPGLPPGKHPVRLRTAQSDFGDTCFVFVDVPVPPRTTFGFEHCATPSHGKREYAVRGQAASLLSMLAGLPRTVTEIMFKPSWMARPLRWPSSGIRMGTAPDR